MVKVLRDRVISLGRDEDGVALVVTLAVFFFLYLFCAGVFAVGNAVKERIHLQNAVDAAAYSAAVVQADAISRIATVNRAMSWTYAQMTKRQMDYIVCKWLKHTVAHYEQDKNSAMNQGSPGAHSHPYWYIGVDPRTVTAQTYRSSNGLIPSPFVFSGDANTVRLNQGTENLSGIKGHSGSYKSEGEKVRNIRGNFEIGHLADTANRESMYAVSSAAVGSLNLLKRQIEEDRQTIRNMNDALENLSDARMGRRIKDAARDVLRANVPAYMRGECDYVVRASDNPRRDYMRVMTGNEEPQFLAWGHPETIRRRFTDASQVPSATFRIGSQTWFPLKNPASEGIQRSYDSRYESSANTLVTSWDWWTVRWNCRWTPPMMVGPRVVRAGYWLCTWSPAGFCEHGVNSAAPCVDCNRGTCDHCQRRTGGFDPLQVKTARLRASHLEDTCYNNDSATCARAMPLMLTKNYFGRKGSITVGIVRHDGNPWRAVVGKVTGGIYSAFNPFNDTWCFASAKAGYKLYDVQTEWERDLNGLALAINRSPDYRNSSYETAVWMSRDYCIDWKEPVSSRSESVVQEPIYNEFGRIVGWRDVYEKMYDAKTNSYYWRLKRVRVTDIWRQSWNLTQSDWDAVMIPVRQAASTAVEGKEAESHLDWMRRVQAEKNKRNGGYAYMYQPVWIGRNDSCLRDVVQSGEWKSLDGTRPVALKTTAFAGEAEGEGVWRIGSPGAKLDWSRITRMMYH